MPARDLDALIALLPQKPPFLFVDHVLAVEPLRQVTGTKTFPPGDPIFRNHLPGEPLVPGVIIIEALAQLAGLALVAEDERPMRGYLGEVTRMRFHRPVHPGEEIRLHVEMEQAFGPFARFAARAAVGEDLVAEGALVLARR
jgi:3-hydroxymyristoyl/3-hydroxydecanoyl-(acyl carrier protein) dehydratase